MPTEWRRCPADLQGSFKKRRAYSTLDDLICLLGIKRWERFINIAGKTVVSMPFRMERIDFTALRNRRMTIYISWHSMMGTGFTSLTRTPPYLIYLVEWLCCSTHNISGDSLFFFLPSNMPISYRIQSERWLFDTSMLFIGNKDTITVDRIRTETRKQ